MSNNPTFLKKAIELVLSQKMGFLSACLRGVVLAPCPFIYKQVVDVYIPTDNLQAIFGSIIICIGILMLHYPLSVFGSKLIGKTVTKEGSDLRSRIFNKIQFLSFSYLDGQKTGRLVSKYSFDTQKVQDSLMALTGNIVPTLVFSGATIIVLIIIDWRMSLVMLLLLPMIYATKKVFFRVMKDGNKQSRIAQEKTNVGTIFPVNAI